MKQKFTFAKVDPKNTIACRGRTLPDRTAHIRSRTSANKNARRLITPKRGAALRIARDLVEPAPMAGYTDIAFRKTLRKCGAKVTWTEMVSATALFHNNAKTKEMLKKSGRTIVQLFGKNPTHFESVIRCGILDKFEEININMGCPARKITSNGDGCALMKNTELAHEIIQSCVRSSKRPISVKMRLGFAQETPQTTSIPYAVQFALMCQSAGASRLIVHGRFGTQGYSGKADWNAISEIARAINIPVIANGDIRNASKAAECIEATKTAGAMIGRSLIGAPWNISSKRVNKKRIIQYHIKQHKAYNLPLVELRKHLIAYTHNKDLKKRLATVKSFEEARATITANAQAL